MDSPLKQRFNKHPAHNIVHASWWVFALEINSYLRLQKMFVERTDQVGLAMLRI